MLLAACGLIATAGPLAAQSLFDILFGPPRGNIQRIPLRVPDPRPQPRAHTPQALHAAGEAVTTRLYCVRLCDGFFFPLTVDDRSDGRALCAGFCPAATTDVYRGSTIEIAVNERGRRYSALPAALRFRETRAADCTCRPDGAPGLVPLPLAQDGTLDPGDIVVTTAGVRVFRGGQAPHRERDFIAYAEARLPRQLAQQLAQIDRYTRPAPQQRIARAPAPATVAQSGPVTGEAEAVPRAPLRIRIIGTPSAPQP